MKFGMPSSSAEKPANPVTKPEDVKTFFESEEKMRELEVRSRGVIAYVTKKEEIDGVEVEAEYVVIAGIELPVNKEGIGTLFKPEEFLDFSLDSKSLELLGIYAQAIKLNQPVLVEGETDIGKTKALEFLSFLTNTRLKRISFSGQTDVTEFIGKYVPNIESAQKLFEKTLENKSKLSAGSLAIIARAEEEKRGLTKEESQEIAEMEGIHLEDVNWVWQDGMIPQAMEGNSGRGFWLYFDELGAAEPSVLVKTNRIFERKGRLELSENGGRLVEAGPDFRIIASTNPPEYAGREAFAPDYVRRFVYQKVGPLNPTEIRARTAFIFRQQQSLLDPDGFHISAENPVNLHENPEISEIIETALVEFHTAALKQLEAGLAKDQNQQFRYEFSDLIRVRDFVNKLQEVDLLQTLRSAVEFYYVNKLGNENAREKLRSMFETTLILHKTEQKLKAALKKIQSPTGTEDLSEHKEIPTGVEDGPEKLSPGHYNVSFNESPDRFGNRGFISKSPNRKTIVLDKGSNLKPEKGVEYHVRVVKETYPGEFRGVMFVTIIDKSRFQKLVEEMKSSGYAFVVNRSKFDYSVPGVAQEIPRIDIAREVADIFGIPVDKVAVKGLANDIFGNSLDDHYSIWTKE